MKFFVWNLMDMRVHLTVEDGEREDIFVFTFSWEAVPAPAPRLAMYVEPQCILEIGWLTEASTIDVRNPIKVLLRSMPAAGGSILFIKDFLH